MPAFKKYPGENPITARRRISRNRINSKLGLPTESYNRPGSRGVSPTRGPQNRGTNRPMGGLRNRMANRPARKIGSGGSRRMRTPGIGNVLTGRNRRGY